MLFGGRRAADITADNIRGLVAAIPEGTGVDYKLLVGGNDEAKREFLADVSSFANTQGGYLFIGVDEDAGLASAITGFAVADIDSEILRLENLVRDSISPRLPSFEVVKLDVDGATVLVLRVGRSWVAPHMVTFRNVSRFYGRNSAGKYQLDVNQIRQAFIRQFESGVTLRRFRDERLDLISRNLLPGTHFGPGPKLALHLIPIGALEGGTSVDLSQARYHAQLRPLYSDAMLAFATRYTIDGIVMQDPGGGDIARYILLNRTGTIEAVDRALLGFRPGDVLGSPFERTIVDDVSRLLSIQRDLGLDPPVVLFVSLIGVAGWHIVPPGNPIPPPGGFPTIDRDPIHLPEIVLDDLTADVPLELRPLFDAFWQSGGFEKSPNYDPAGNWQRPPG